MYLKVTAAGLILFLTGESPAMAAWDRIGAVDIPARTAISVHYSRFGGPVDAVSLQARNSNVVCRDIGRPTKTATTSTSSEAL
jgi:hypothetical protein